MSGAGMGPAGGAEEPGYPLQGLLAGMLAQSGWATFGRHADKRCCTQWGVAPSEEVAPVASSLPELPGQCGEVEDCGGFGGVDSAALTEDPNDLLLNLSQELPGLLLGGDLADEPLGAVVLVLLHHLQVPGVRHDRVRHLPLQPHQLLHGDLLWGGKPLTVMVLVVV